MARRSARSVVKRRNARPSLARMTGSAASITASVNPASPARQRLRHVQQRLALEIERARQRRVVASPTPSSRVKWPKSSPIARVAEVKTSARVVGHLAPEQLRRGERRDVELHCVLKTSTQRTSADSLGFPQPHEEVTRRARAPRAGVESLGAASCAASACRAAGAPNSA
jgi:hypothetical protein